MRCATLSRPRHLTTDVPVAIAAESHPFPSRTRKLSPPAPMVLGARAPGRVGRRRTFSKRAPPVGGALARFVRSGPCLPHLLIGAPGARFVGAAVRAKGSLPGATRNTGAAGCRSASGATRVRHEGGSADAPRRRMELGAARAERRGASPSSRTASQRAARAGRRRRRVPARCSAPAREQPPAGGGPAIPSGESAQGRGYR